MAVAGSATGGPAPYDARARQGEGLQFVSAGRQGAQEKAFRRGEGAQHGKGVAMASAEKGLYLLGGKAHKTPQISSAY